MHRQAIAIATAILVGWGGQAAAKTPDKPHRPMGKVAILDMPFNEAQACIARQLDESGSVLVLPVESGSDIDWTIPGALFAQTAGEPYATFQLRQDDQSVRLNVLYRRPLSASSMEKTVRNLSKKCLVVKSYVDEPVVATPVGK